MKYNIQEIKSIISGQFLSPEPFDYVISNIIFDSRKISFAKRSIFFCLTSSSNDGHNFIGDAYDKGVRNFIVERHIDQSKFQKANFILVPSSLEALQSFGKYHRNKFDIPVIAITGSNGKTIIKEWLGECLATKMSIYKSPLSYNSQIGVPLSLLQLDNTHEMAILEAGISLPGEMEKHASTISPQFGILSNIGDAHDSGFNTKRKNFLKS